MTISTIAADGNAVRSNGSQDPVTTRRPPGAIRFWAVMGSLTTALVLSSWLRWITSEDFQKPTPGPDEYEHLWWLRTVEVLSLSLVLGFFYFCLVRPWWRERRVTFDGKLLIGCMLAYWVDPILNYFNHSFAMNAHALSGGAWTEFIPGFASPGQARFAEGVLWAGAMYTYFGLGAAIIGCGLLKRLRARFPRASNVSLYAIVYLAVCVGDFLIEVPLFVLPEIYVFSGVPKFGTLWAGEVYQFPIYEMLLVGVFSLGFIWLRDSRDDRGRTAVERGVDELNAGPRTKGLLSFLAIAGAAFVIALTYFLPYSWLSMKADSYPTLPSYLRTAGYCGQPDRPLCPSQYIRQLDREFEASQSTSETE